MTLFSRANSLGYRWRRVGGLLIPFLLAVEATAVDRTWDGGAAGADANWTTAANWTTNIAPNPGDLLIFASGPTKSVTTNTFPANTLFRGFSIRDDYTLRGAAVDLTNVVEAVSGQGILDLNLRLQRPVLFDSSFVGSLIFARNRTLTLNNFDLTIDGLNGNCHVDGNITDVAAGTGRWIVTGHDFEPPLSGGGNTVVLNGTFNGLGVTLVTNDSKLILNGAIRSQLILAATSTLSGTGTVGQVTAAGQISPGGTSPGRLTVTGACVFASSATLSVFLAGTNAGVTHDQVQCGAAVNLGSAHLVISRDPNFLPAIGSSFTILNKTSAGAVTGTFAGLPQGGSTTVGGIFFQVSYAGGDGNDVTLTVTNRDFQVWDGGGANNLWTTAANWEGDKTPSASNHLAFPRGAPDAVTTNDFPVDTVFNSLRFTGSAATNNYPRLRGNSIKLLSGIVATNLGSQGVVAIELPLKLAASQTFSNASANTAIELRSDLAVAPFALTVRGAGTFRATGSILGANNTNLVQVNGGHLIVNGTVTGPVLVAGGGDLGGTGTMDGLGLTNSSLSPGDGGPGILKVRGGLSLNSGSTLNLELNDSAPGTGYDQLVVSNGNANLSLATLNLVVRTNLSSAIGDLFTLVNLTNPTNTVTGAFAGLPNGTLFTNNARVFRISYSGGDGNDVVLSLVDVIATGTTRQWAGGDPVTNLWSARSNWFPAVAPAPGDSLAFATPNSRLTNFNDFPADTSFGSMFFAVPFGRFVNYSLAGNPIRLSAGVGMGPAAPSSLDMQGLVIISNRITLNNSQIFTNALDARLRFAGNILLGTNTLFANVRGNTDIFLDGSLQGPGRLELDGPGRVNLNASNALTGEMFVSNGVLIATHPQALGSSQAGPVRVGAAGTLRLQASNTTFTGSSIQLTGRLEVLSSTNSVLAVPLTAAGSNAVVALSQASGSFFTLQASVTNQGQLVLGDAVFSTGSILRLPASSSVEGTGVLRVGSPFDANGTVHNAVQVESRFGGAGQIDTLICSNAFGSIFPGSLTDPALAFSPLRVGQLRLSAGLGSQVTLNLFPNRPGGGPTNQSIITSAAPVLGGARLRVNALTNLSPGQKFMLLRNDSAAPVTNTFAGLPEGAFLAATNGNLGLQITYAGGDGNDVVLTAQSNTPPIVTPVQVSIGELGLLSFTNSAGDLDRPAQSLSWALLSAPPGAAINPTNGVLTWVPTEEQGPSTNVLTLRVTDNGVPPLSSTNTVTVTVFEINRPPVPVPVPDTNVLAGNNLTIQLTALDPDVPANQLIWGPPQSLPPGATVSSNGLFSYTPAPTESGTKLVNVTLRDFSPAAVNQKSFTNSTLSFHVFVRSRRIVTNTNDSGAGSLRQALTEVNTNTAGGQVEFNISGAGPFKIAPLTALPPLLRDTLIDGFTQPGAAPNTSTNGLNPTLLIELSGENTTNQAGLQWPGATGTPRVTVRGLCLNRWGKAISTGCQFCNSGVGLSLAPVIEGCFIGTDPGGTQARSNGVGIVFAEAFGGRIGGSAPAQRNLISGNAQAGISLEWDLSDAFLQNFTVQGNLIGTDRTGTNALGNGGPGIAAQATLPTTNSVIADNVICANGQGGLVVAGLGNSVLRNRIGVGADGATALGNAGAGLEVLGSQHQVGGANGLDANLIANNSGPGVHVGAGAGHSILGNSIFRNGGLAIDLGAPGPTANDLGDGDGGPNNLQNKPVLTNAIITGASEVVVSGSFNSASNSVYRLEFFHSPDFSPSNAPQARTFLGSTDLATDGAGNARISVVTAVPSTDGFITATATDGANNTSEISAGARIGTGDFFEGVLPNLSIVSGNGQSNPVNLFLEAPLVVRVTTTNGILLTSAPVTFTVVQGDATLAESLGASARFPTLQVNTSGDGQAQVFCRLGQIAGITNLIRATVTSGARSTNVVFAAVSLAAQREGVVLQGNPASPALDAMVNLRPVGVGRNQIEDGVILTRLDVVLDPGATVGQVNAALDSIGGGIVTMRPGSPFATVSIPAPANASVLPAVAQALGSAPGVLFAFVGRETRVQAFPFPDATEIFALASTEHLLPTRFPAAWNATNLLAGCSGNRVKVLVVDHFKSSPPTTINFASQILHSTLSDPAPDSNETQDHGYLVAATVGGLFDATVPTGANPFCDCLDFRLVQTLGMTMAQCNQQFADNMPVGEFVVNMSKGFAGFCSNTCTPEIVLRQVPSAIERAASALNWRGLTSGRWNDFLFAAAAGNDRDQELAPVYAGMTLAAFKSEPIINSSTDILLTFAGDSSLWAPKAGFANFPDLTATPVEMQHLSVLLSRLPAGALEPAENVISVGSTTDGLVPEDLDEAPFSNTGPDVKAVGQHLQICPITQAKSDCEDLGGTSFSSPQVAALASYLWLLSPDLRLRSPADTITAIRANARVNTHTTDILDAYATVLSLDPATLPEPATARIRKAILDVNNDSKFDQADIQIFLSHYFAGGVPLEPATRDYSRFDLNGDGFTGGGRTESFDLDRVDSTQFGETFYTVVKQSIEGVDVDFDELQLTDQEILCYYAYSPLYQGDPAVRSALLRDICLPVIVTVVPEAVGLSPGQTRQFIASVGGLPNLDQRVTWTIAQGAGSVTADGLFTPDCSLTDGHSQTVIVRATSVAFPQKFAEARVTVQMPLVTFSTSVNAGLVRRGTVGPFSCGSGFDQLDDGPDPSKFPDGNNFVSGELQCFCASPSPGSAIKVPHNVVAGSVTSAGATMVGRFTAPIQTQVSVAFNSGWGTGNFRITAAMSGANGSTVNNVTAVFDPAHSQNSVFAPFQIPAGTVMDMTLDAQCTGNSSGNGTAVTVTLAPVVAPGISTLAPAEAAVPVTQPLTYAFTWTVPEPENWHDLRELQFRIRDGDQILLWTRFTESDQSFSLYSPASGRFGSTAAAGDRMRLETSLALLDLQRTSVKASGPTSPSVTLNLGVAFKPSAAGRACIVEVAAVDDEGHVDDFKEAGRLTLQPAR